MVVIVSTLQAKTTKQLNFTFREGVTDNISRNEIPTTEASLFPGKGFAHKRAKVRGVGGRAKGGINLYLGRRKNVKPAMGGRFYRANPNKPMSRVVNTLT